MKDFFIIIIYWEKMFKLSLLGLAVVTKAANVLEATATLRPSDTASQLSGYVTFRQVNGNDPLSGVEVDVSKLTGVPAGRHGFHIHQFGDSTSPEKVGGHFVPLCAMRRALDDTGTTTLTCGENELDRKCACDEIHGFPPSAKRMPGDMGNLDCATDGACLLCFTGDTRASGCAASKTLLQQKMSLSNDLRSVIGRSVAIHTREDSTAAVTINGLGDAGPAIAYGTVGITAPGAALPSGTATSQTTDTNVAAPPASPPADKTVCIFRSNIGTSLNTGISGKAIISIDLNKKLQGLTDYCNMRVEMTGLTAGTRSFHFHKNGDLRYGLTADGTLKTKLIGAIYNSNKLEVKEWNIQSVNPSIFETPCTMGDVSELVGRSLTIHEGADASSATIAMAVCGTYQQKSKKVGECKLH